MDILFSLPLASYFLASSSPLSSWSTSINLLFFYLTWTTLVLSHPPLAVHLVGITAIRAILCLAPSLLSLAFDAAVPSLAEGIKFGGHAALPPRDGPTIVRLVGLALFNLGVLVGVEGLCSFAFASAMGEPEFRTTTTLPLPWSIVKHILGLLAAREVLVYHINRKILHGNKSSYIAQQHQRFAHARRAPPFSLQLLADHPCPLLLHRFIPLYLPALIFRPHLLTYLLFVALCTVEETLAMSGYSIVPGIIMGGITQRAAVHYAGGGTSNFGAWGLLDWVYGTSRGRDVLEDVRAEADKHRVKERSERKASQGAGMLQNGMEALRNGAGDTPRRSGRKRTPRRLE